MALATHRLAMATFDAVAAGGGGDRGVRELRRISRSRQLALLRVVLDDTAVRSNGTGPLPKLEYAWDLLIATQRHAPHIAERFIDHPHLGGWAVEALRRLRRPDVDDTPLWAVLGYLHSIAAAAAITAGLSFRIRLPMRDGVVVLPALGCTAAASGGRSWQVAELCAEHGQVLISRPAGDVLLPADPATDADQWRAARRLRVGTGRLRLDVLLDEDDPFREFDGLRPPVRLAPAEFDRWRHGLATAWTQLVGHHHDMAEELAAGLTDLVPWPSRSRFSEYSTSNAYAFGCAGLSLPDDATTLAATLVHEMQHSKLSALLSVVDLCPDDSTRRFYSPWRDDPRPLAGLLHAAYSFAAVTKFWHEQRAVGSDGLAEFEFAYRRRQTAYAMRTLGVASELTPWGRRFVDTMAAGLARWSDQVVSADPLAAAVLVCADHRSTWRMAHVRADPEYVVELAKAWLAGASEPPAASRALVLEPSSSSRPRQQARLELARLRLGDPDFFLRVRSKPTIVDDGLTGWTAADLALVDGDTAAAAGYLAELAIDPGDAGAWVGLGLALLADERETAHRAAGRALLARPELVRAVWRYLLAHNGNQPNVPRLAAWLGTGAGWWDSDGD